MIIENKTKTPIYFHTQVKIASGNKAVPVPGTLYILMPGFNEIPDDDYNNVEVTLKDEINVDKVALHHVVNDTKKVKGQGADGKVTEVETPFKRGKSIAEISPQQAKVIIENCWSLQSLERWLEGSEATGRNRETRDEVRTRIKDQIEKIKSHKGAKAS